MIQEAFISGQIGQVIYVENKKYFVLHSDNLEEPKECHPIDVSTFFGLGAEVKSLANGQLNLDYIKTQLVSQQRAYRALMLIISGMDKVLSHESRTSAITTAERLAEEPSTHRFVRARLLARPVPEEAD